MNEAGKIRWYTQANWLKGVCRLYQSENADQLLIQYRVYYYNTGIYKLDGGDAGGGYWSWGKVDKRLDLWERVN